VLCHELWPNRWMTTTHAGILVHEGGQQVYLEKAGGSGPFVRLDFSRPRDLADWLAAPLHASANGKTNGAYFATFNADRIERLP
jgi:hypothetical protein